MASQYKSNDKKKKALAVDRPLYGPVKAAQSTIDQVSQPFQASHQQQGVPTTLSQASMAEHAHGVHPQGQVMLDRWLQEPSNNDPYNAVGEVFAAGNYNVKAKECRSSTAGRGTR